MQLVLVNGSLACSSLLFGDFGSGQGDWTAYLKQVRQYVWNHHNGAFEANSISSYAGYGFNQYAVVTASTIIQQKGIQELFRKIGMGETNEVLNGKNATKVIFFSLSVPEFIESVRKLWKDHCDNNWLNYDTGAKRPGEKPAAPITTADVIAGKTKVAVAKAA